MKKNITILTIVTLLAATLLTGCETTGQSAGLGAGIGALAGGIIGHQSGRAAEGALIGAALGGIVGGIIGHEKQKRLASKKEMEELFYQQYGENPTESMVYWDQFSVTPTTVKPGDALKAKGEYVRIGPEPDTPPTGTVYLLADDGTLVEEMPMEEVNDGRFEFERVLNIPDSLQDGNYKLAVEVQSGTSSALKEDSFTIASKN